MSAHGTKVGDAWPASGNPPDRFKIQASWVAAAIACFAAGTTLYYLRLVLLGGYADVPLFDQMTYLTPRAILDLWKHHNGAHLIVFPRLIFWIDDAFFAGRNTFNIAMILLSQTAEVLLFVLLARALGFRSRPATIFVAATAVVLAFATCQHESFVWGWEIQYVLVDVAFAAGAYALMRYAETDRWPWLVGAAVGGLVSVGSLGNGLAALPLLALLAIAYRRRTAALVLSLTAVAATAIYWATRDSAPMPGAGLHGDVAYTTTYALVLLGNPISQTLIGQDVRQIGDLPASVASRAIAIGAIMLVLSTLALISVFARVRRDGNRVFVRLRNPINEAGESNADARTWRAGLALAAIILFAFAAILLTTDGRSWGGLAGALSDRYATPILPIAIAVPLLLGQAWSSSGWAPGVRRLAGVTLALCLATFALAGARQMKAVVEKRDAHERMMMAIAVGVEDPSLLPVRLINLDIMRSGFARLRADHKSLFSEAWVESIGEPLNHLAPLGVGGRCEGSVEPILRQPTPQANRVFEPLGGSVWASHDEQPKPTIVLTDQQLRIVGVGRVQFTLADIKGGGIRVNHERARWGGEMAPDANGPITAFLLVTNGRMACELGRTVALANSAGPG